MLSKLFQALAVAMLAFPAMAGESAWVEIAPDARVRLISSDTVAGGKMFAALEIDMPENMKTYWRIPGETGIPVEIDMSQSRGVSINRIIWPYPLREHKDGFVDFVYYGHTVLPLELDIGSSTASAAANVTMGVCTDICVPVRAELSLPLDLTNPDRANDLRVRQAVAAAPLAYEGDGHPVGGVHLSAGGKRLSVTFDPAEVDPQSVIVDTGDPAALFSMPDPDVAQNAVLFEPIGRHGVDDLPGETVRVTFMTRDGAYEVVRTVQSADSTGGE